MFTKIPKLQPILTNVYLNGIDECHCSWDNDKITPIIIIIIRNNNSPATSGHVFGVLPSVYRLRTAWKRVYCSGISPTPSMYCTVRITFTLGNQH